MDATKFRRIAHSLNGIFLRAQFKCARWSASGSGNQSKTGPTGQFGGFHCGYRSFHKLRRCHAIGERDGYRFCCRHPVCAGQEPRFLHKGVGQLQNLCWEHFKTLIMCVFSQRKETLRGIWSLTRAVAGVGSGVQAGGQTGAIRVSIRGEVDFRFPTQSNRGVHGYVPDCILDNRFISAIVFGLHAHAVFHGICVAPQRAYLTACTRRPPCPLHFMPTLV